MDNSALFWLLSQNRISQVTREEPRVPLVRVALVREVWGRGPILSGGGLSSTLSGMSQGPTSSGGSQGLNSVRGSLGPILKGRILRLSLSGRRAHLIRRNLGPSCQGVVLCQPWQGGVCDSSCTRGVCRGPPCQEESRTRLSGSSLGPTLAWWSLWLILYKRSLQGPPCQGHKRKEIRIQDHMRECHALKRINTENWKQIFSEKELHGHTTVSIPY